MFNPSNDHQPQTELDMDLPPIVPVWPSPGTIHELLLKALIEHGSINIDEFHKLSGSHEVRKTICDLLDLGWPITDMGFKPAPVQRDPRRKLMRYRLELSRIDFTKAVRP